MTTTNGNRKILDLKRWEFCTPAPAASQAGSCITASTLNKQLALYVRSSTEAYLYNCSEDGWVQVPTTGLGGTFGAGGSLACIPWSTGTTTAAASLTATAGTTSTITTNQTIARDLRGFQVHFLAGPNAGAIKEIASNTIGANSVITFTSAEASAFSNSSVYRLLTPRWFYIIAGIAAATTHRFYDYATNTWNSVAQNPVNASNDCRYIPTPSFAGSSFDFTVSGLATGGTGTTLQNSGKSWTASQWINAQVVITAGTGAGQIRTITANDATSITVATWGTNPDSTSEYVITGNDDHIYWLGNNASTLYRYNITANTWTTLSPSVARGGNAGSGFTVAWVNNATDSVWSNESVIINGRRIYSGRGAGQVFIDYYDIPSNAWTNDIIYSPKTETTATGAKSVYYNDWLYIQKEATGRWFRYNIPQGEYDGWTTMLYTQGSAVAGNTAFDIHYTDGATTISYIYMLLNTSTVMLRQMVI